MRVEGALEMEVQSINDSVTRIMFVTSGDNKIVDEPQVPSNVSIMATPTTQTRDPCITGVCHRSCERSMEVRLGGGWRVISCKDGMWIWILEGDDNFILF